MNPFEQLLQQAGRLGIGFKAPQLTKSAADAVTNLDTYRRLAKAAEQTLGRALPTEFRGANFANIPTRATGYLSDVGQMAEGAARNIKEGVVQGLLDSMAGRSPRPTGLMQGGTPAARPINPTAFPQQIGAPGPYAQDYGLTRQFVKDVGGKTLTEAAERLSTPVGKVGGLFKNLGGLVKPNFAMGKELVGLGGVVNRFVVAPTVGSDLFNQGQTGSLLDQSLRIIPSTKSTDLGRSAGNELNYIGKNIFGGRIPYTGGGVSNLPSEFPSINGSHALNVAGAGRYVPGEQQKFIPSPGNQNRNAQVPPAPQLPPPSTNPVADRAYAAERSSVAQQAAQNPMLQQYQNLRATNPAAVQNLGMQAWAQQYGGPEGLANQVKPGQVGYDVIQQALAGQTASSTSKIPGVVSQPWAEGVVSVGGATRAGLPMTPEEEAQLQYQMFNYRPE